MWRSLRAGADGPMHEFIESASVAQPGHPLAPSLVNHLARSGAE